MTSRERFQLQLYLNVVFAYVLHIHSEIIHMYEYISIILIATISNYVLFKLFASCELLLLAVGGLSQSHPTFVS